MTDAIVYVQSNNRLAGRGVADMQTYVILPKAEKEVKSFKVDWSDYLGSETIASAENDLDNATTSAITITGTTTTFTVSGDGGWIRHRITTSAGTIKELRIYVQEPNTLFRDDYGRIQWL